MLELFSKLSKKSSMNRILKDAWIFLLTPVIKASFEEINLRNYIQHLFRINLFTNFRAAVEDIKLHGSHAQMTFNVIIAYFFTEYSLSMLFLYVSIVFSLILYSVNIVVYFITAYFFVSIALFYELQNFFSKTSVNLILFGFSIFAINKIRNAMQDRIEEKENKTKVIDYDAVGVGVCRREILSDNEPHDPILTKIDTTDCEPLEKIMHESQNSKIDRNFQDDDINSESQTLISFTESEIESFKKPVFFNNPGPKVVRETGDSLLNFGFIFYLQLFFLFCFTLIQAFILRFQNLNVNSYVSFGGVLYYVIMMSYVSGYTSRAITTKYLSCYIYEDSEMSYSDFLSLFLTCRLASAFKPILIILSLFRKFCRKLIKGTKFDHENFLWFLDDDRCGYFYTVLKQTTFFEGLMKSRRHLWKGAIKRNITKINIKEDLFPSILTVGMVLKVASANIFSLFRPMEVFFIVLANFFIVIEVFNSYGVMEVLEFVKVRGNNSFNGDIPFGDFAGCIKIRQNKRPINCFFDQMESDRAVVNAEVFAVSFNVNSVNK